MKDLPTQHGLLLGAYDALFEDIIRWIPSANRKALSWDKTQLARLVLDRGQRYLTIDLPEFGKVFEQSLNSGALLPHSVPGFGKLRTRRGKDNRPRLFWALLSRVFKFDGTLRDHACPLSILYIRQLCYLFKKMKGDCSDTYKYAAIRDFYDIEAEMVPPTLNWGDPFSFDSPSPVSVCDGVCPSTNPAPYDSEAWRSDRNKDASFQRVFDLLVGLLPDFDPYRIEGRHGPGAVADGQKGKSKFDFPHWTERLEAIFPYDWHASSCFMQGEEYPLVRDIPSKLDCVQKSQKGPRLIASESICNQWIQQGIASWFIKSFEQLSFLNQSIRIDDQTHNQEAARRASLGDGATIDLSSASDRLSCFLVERLFRRKPDLLSAMSACRALSLSNKIDKTSPALIELKKFSTMGSALTFPVQSFVFYSIAVASVLNVRKLGITISNIDACSKEVRVYGDDIVVPRDCSGYLIDALHRFGLKVNMSKTHDRGFFRESCGTDWYKGECVTPSYIRSDFDPRRPGTVSTIVETSNNFHLRGMWVLADFVLRRLPTRIRLRIAVSSSVSAIKGFYSFVGESLSHLVRRYNDHLHRYEVRVAILKATRPDGYPDGLSLLRQHFADAKGRVFKNVPIWDIIESSSPRVVGRATPSYRERYVPLYSGI